jgi:hypothetical protein
METEPTWSGESLLWVATSRRRFGTLFRMAVGDRQRK